MRKILLGTLCAAFVAACGDGGTTLPALTSQTARIAFVNGGLQEDTVAQQLPNALTVRVTDDGGRARSGVLVNFVVVEPGCGRAFAGSAQTDANGEARERWELGTKAGTCHMEARAVDQKTGEALVFDRVEARALADRADTVRFLQGSPTFRASGGVHAVPLFIGESFALSTVQLRAADRFGNEAASAGLTWTAPAPLQISNNQITATAEGIARATLAGVTRADSLYVVALENLRAKRWVADWTCRSGIYTTFFGTSFQADSARWRMVVDSVQYLVAGFEPGSLRDTNPPVASHRTNFFGTLTATVWWSDGTVSVNDATRFSNNFAPNTPIQGPWPNQQRQAQQYPGALNTLNAFPLPGNTRPETVALRVADTPVTYAGGAGGWCGINGRFISTSFRLTAQN